MNPWTDGVIDGQPMLYPGRKIEVLIHTRFQAFVANIFSVCSVSPWWIVFLGILNTETRSSPSLHGEIRLLRDPESQV